MKGAPTSFWGKLQQDEEKNPIAWHPLEDHCADVAACCEALLEGSILRRRLARLGDLPDLSREQISRLCVFAALHDIGKFNLGFQNKAWPNVRPTAGHVKEALSLLDSFQWPEGKRAKEALDWAPMFNWGAEKEVFCYLLIAAIAHHGRPEALDDKLEHRQDLWKAQKGLDPFEGISGLRKKVERWFPEAFSPVKDPLPACEPFQHAFSGLVMLADWLGSDTHFFPYSEEGEGERFFQSREKARQIVKEMGLNPSRARLSLGAAPPGFDRISKHTPHPAQRKTLDLPQNRDGSLTILESETGSGKTEAALARFLQLFHAGAVDGLYFALPTRTAATQIHERVKEAVERAFPDEASRPPVVLAVPGYLKVDAVEGTRLPGFEVLWNDDDRERFRFRGWAAERPKRYLAASIAVGTIDQVLLSALAVSHAHLRATSLFRQLLVVDEVHASDAYMNRILEEVLQKHLLAGGHAFLMSATLGAVAREKFLALGKLKKLSTLEAARAVPYPLLTHRLLPGPAVTVPITEPVNSKAVQTRLLPIIGDPDAIARRALDAAERGAKVLVLRNTVRECLQSQAALERLASARGKLSLCFSCEGKLAPHHARFAREDRAALDIALTTRFDKEAPQGGSVVVATQTVQQSLDIDADLLLTDLCPMDVLLQRIGRLHRHQRSRPAGFEEPTLEVLVPEERSLAGFIRKKGEARGPHGFGPVYQDLRILEATWRLLEKHPTLTIPQENRILVEESTHPEALKAIVEEFGGIWQEHYNTIHGKTAAERLLASQNLANWKDLIGEQESCFSSGELAHSIKTRLGEGDRLVHLGEAMQSPFGRKIHLLTLPAHFVAEAPSDALPEDIQEDEEGFCFSFGQKRFRYDRLGLHPVDPMTPDDDISDA